MDEWDQFGDADPWGQFNDAPGNKKSRMDPRLETAARSTVKGLSSPLAFFVDAVNAMPNLAAKGINAVAGEGTVGYLPMGKDYVDAGLRHAGVNPEPQSTPERAVTAALSAASSGGLATAARSLFGGLPGIEAVAAQPFHKQAVAASSGVLGNQVGREIADKYNIPEPYRTAIEVAGGVGAGAIATPAIFGAAGGISRTADALSAGGREKIAGRILNRQAAVPEQVISRATTMNRQLVPGSQPTLAEVSQDPGIARLQRSMTSSPLAIDAGADQVNAVRNAQMDDAIYESINRANKVGTNPSKGDVIDRLAAYRKQLGTEWNTTLAKQGVNPSHLPVQTQNTETLLQDLKQRYSGSGPIEDLVDQMSGKLIPKDKPVVFNGATAVSPPTNRFQNVWNQRQNLDTLLYEKLINAPSGYKADLKSVGEQIRTAMNQDLVTAVPEFKDFLHRYSRAIQMEQGLKAGREIMGSTTNTARNLTTEDDQLYGARSISGAKMDNLNLSMQEAKRGVKLTPNQQAAFEAAQEEKRRANILATGGAPGNSQTAQNLAMDQIISRDIMSGVFGDNGKTGIRSLASSVMGTPFALTTQLVGRGAQADILQLVAKGLMSPEEGKRLMALGQIENVDPSFLRNSLGGGVAGQLHQFMTR